VIADEAPSYGGQLNSACPHLDAVVRLASYVAVDRTFCTTASPEAAAEAVAVALDGTTTHIAASVAAAVEDDEDAAEHAFQSRAELLAEPTVDNEIDG